METWLTTTKQFDKWRDNLGETTRARVDARVALVRTTGHLGDHHGLRDADRISEMRIDSGPGWRLYYTTWEYRGQVVLLLLGGDKSSQRRDIKKAKNLLPAAKERAEREIDEAIKQREEERKHGTDAGTNPGP